VEEDIQDARRHGRPRRAILMNRKVWRLGSHQIHVRRLSNAKRPSSVRKDKVGPKCPDCGGDFPTPSRSTSCLDRRRPVASTMPKFSPGNGARIFVDYQLIQETTRVNCRRRRAIEIVRRVTPGNFVFRVRELNRVKLNILPPERGDQVEECASAFGLWLACIKKDNIRFYDKKKSWRITRRTTDVEFAFPFARRLGRT